MSKIKLTSFSYCREQPKTPFVFDCRFLPNPWKTRYLKSLDGRDEAVQEWLRGYPSVRALVDEAIAAIKSSGTQHAAFGCYGGHHRSVAVVEMVADALGRENVEIDHTNLDKSNDHPDVPSQH